MRIGAIDPGQRGALALYDGKEIKFIDFDLLDYVNELIEFDPTFVMVERVHSMPRQGVVSTFTFGQRYGELIGVLTALAIKYDTVLPQTWRKVCGIDKGLGKEQVANTLLSLYPNANLYSKRGALRDGRSDALGILHYTIKENIK